MEEKEFNLTEEIVEAVENKDNTKLKELFDTIPNIDIAEAMEDIDDIKVFLYVFRSINDEYSAEVFAELSAEDRPCGLVFHNGRFYCCCLNGVLYILDTDGSILKKIVPEYENRILKMNDLVFIDEDIYVTDFRGNYIDRTGGIYVLKAEEGYQKAELLLGGLCSPNGIGHHDGRVFVSETTAGNILRIQPDENRQVAEEFGVMPIYSNLGHGGGLDSIKMAADGSIYQAVMAGGRVLKLDQEGIVFEIISVEGAEEGKNLLTPNLALNEKEGYGLILAFGNDGLKLMRFPVNKQALQ